MMDPIARRIPLYLRTDRKSDAQHVAELFETLDDRFGRQRLIELLHRAFNAARMLFDFWRR
jgi:hypothetical protein